MESLLKSSEFTHTRVRGFDVYHRPEIAPEDVLFAIEEPGEELKRSRKSVTRRVGPVIIKSSLPGAWGSLKLTVKPERYRRGFMAAQHLEACGVGTPRTLAYVEQRHMGLFQGNHQISEYLDGWVNTEQQLLRLIQTGAGKLTISAYLARIADAVNTLTASGAVHEDLSGKNILTMDGEIFAFVDLDAVTIGDYTDAKRLANMVQLYDSFCDALSDAVMVPFITRMLPPDVDPRVWMPKIRKGQQERRRAHEEKNPGAPRPLLPQGRGAAGSAHS